MMPKECSYCSSLSVILNHSALKWLKNYYPQLLLGECKYMVKDKKISRYINDDLEIFSDDSDEDTDKQ